jgi:hypothetical protein
LQLLRSDLELRPPALAQDNMSMTMDENMTSMGDNMTMMGDNMTGTTMGNMTAGG